MGHRHSKPVSRPFVRESTLSQSLSIILPVRDAEPKLASMVHQLLEVTSDLTSDLELMIVDDGSIDNTEEVAMELCRQYPQVKTLRYAKPAGHISAVRVGITYTHGDVVLIQNIAAPISSEAIRELWRMRNDEELVFARAEPACNDTPIPAMHRQPTWSGGTQMLRRDAMNQLYNDPSPSPLESSSTPNAQPKINRVTRTDNRETSTSPAIFQHHSVGMQPDR